jgi:hypothetical protein
MNSQIVFWPTVLLLISPFLSHAQQTNQGAAASPMPATLKKPEEIKFKQPSFTFARIKYSAPGRGQGTGRGTWATDYPEADLNFTRQLQKVTGLKCDTNGIVLELTDPKLRQQPFIYITEGGRMELQPEEVKSLRAYLLGGGFLMVDDFWGEAEWESLAGELRRAFPDRQPIDLPLSHEIFRSCYEIRAKPQVPNVQLGINSQYNGITWERTDAREPHYRGLFDDNGRLMAIFCHNTDLADGWEREGVNEYYYREFSLKKAYPMGINIVVYALTH